MLFTIIAHNIYNGEKMKKIISIIICFICYTIASFPECDINANTTINVSPYIISSNNQNVNLSLTLNCPRDTWFKTFAGYTQDSKINYVPFVNNEACK